MKDKELSKWLSFDSISRSEIGGEISSLDNSKASKDFDIPTD